MCFVHLIFQLNQKKHKSRGTIIIFTKSVGCNIFITINTYHEKVKTDSIIYKSIISDPLKLEKCYFLEGIESLDWTKGKGFYSLIFFRREYETFDRQTISRRRTLS